MNIFVLHRTPKIAAQMHADKHVVKMILESAQMLCTVLHEMGHEAPYKPTHKNHPCTLWAGRSGDNFQWLWRLMDALNEEYVYRYHFGSNKNHKSWEKMVAFCCQDRRLLSVRDFPEMGLTDFAQAMPEQYRCEDPVEAYRAYYRGEKSEILQYTIRRPPDWVEDLAYWKKNRIELSSNLTLDLTTDPV